ncbi:MAG: hypothetical protein H6838_02680 [Planctomycetes bacterium]|nr:hypothetical protein [Planctomycetota bacterium]
MLFARQRDLPFAQATLPTRIATGAGAAVSRSFRSSASHAVVVLDTRPVPGGSAARSGSVAGRVVQPIDEAGSVAGSVAGAAFARKRIEHAIELFGACMFIALALAMALFA